MQVHQGVEAYTEIMLKCMTAYARRGEEMRLFKSRRARETPIDFGPLGGRWWNVGELGSPDDAEAAARSSIERLLRREGRIGTAPLVVLEPPGQGWGSEREMHRAVVDQLNTSLPSLSAEMKDSVQRGEYFMAVGTLSDGRRRVTVVLEA